MTEVISNTAFERVAQRIEPQGKLLRAWELKGGISAHITALEIESVNGYKKNVVVRRHGEHDLQGNPQIAADECKLLQELHTLGLAVPRLYDLDQSCEIFPTPYLVMEYIGGQPEFIPPQMDDFLAQCVTHLTSIHRIDHTQLGLSFLPRQEQRCSARLRERPAHLDESLDEGRIRDVLETIWPIPQHNHSVLLHGDFWPGNLLWKDGRLMAVIDWEDAALGDPLTDIAISRLELLWAFSNEVMQDFTRRYQALTACDLTSLPYWDLWAALRPVGQLADWAEHDTAREQSMREGHGWFVAQALEKLSNL